MDADRRSADPVERKELIRFETRLSDSPFVERMWRSHSDDAGQFHSMASCNWGIVVSRVQGATSITIRGPERMATVADCPAHGEWLGVQFRLGTCMPRFPAAALRDRNDVTLPHTGRTFRLDESAWEYPTWENLETFVQRLIAMGLIVEDPGVIATLEHRRGQRSQRTDQRHFVRVTGLTQVAIRQIERARLATLLLQQGRQILEVAHAVGYFDQAHFTRSLRRFVGQTPGEILRGDRQLSLLYKKCDG